LAGLPFGNGVLFNLDERDGKYKKLPVAEDKKSCLMNTQESIFCQYLSYRNPEAQFVFSNFHAGPGQVVFGNNDKRRVDCTLVFPPGSVVRDREGRPTGRVRRRQEVRYVNYHSNFCHYNNDHRQYCPVGLAEEQAMDDSGCMRVRPILDEDNICRIEAALANDFKNEDTVSSDHFSREYAQQMARVRPSRDHEGLKVVYEIYTECELFCHPRVNAVSSNDGERAYPSIRELLLKEFKNSTVLNSKRKVLTYDEIMEMVFNHEDSDDFGFVLITGGEETADDKLQKLKLGFCLQRDYPKLDRIGAFTRFQNEAANEAGYNYVPLEERCKTKQTFAKMGFHQGGETLSLPYFKWLVQERKLKNFKILHFVHFKRKDFLTSWYDDKLQVRHEFRRGIGQAKEINSSAALCLKLILNANYGFASIQSTSYSLTRVATAKHLKRIPLPKGLYRFNLIGAVTGSTAKPDLLFSYTKKNLDRKIVNCIQMGACILGKTPEGAAQHR
jgi:hypothetical protein